MTIRPASDRSLFISFGEEISLEAHLAVARLTGWVEGVRGILNVHPAYTSVLVDFDPRLCTHAEVADLVRYVEGGDRSLTVAARWGTHAVEELGRDVAGEDRSLTVAARWGTHAVEELGRDVAGEDRSLTVAARRAHAEPRHVEIPVRYGGEFGPDLADVARHTGLSEERVVELHSAAEYLVYFVGFSTCFPYLGGLPPELATPRLAAPRKHVPVGSVAIGGAQAGIYPLASPGGWRLIGRTTVKLFDPGASPPPLLRMGDRVRFVPSREGSA